MRGIRMSVCVEMEEEPTKEPKDCASIAGVALSQKPRYTCQMVIYTHSVSSNLVAVTSNG